MSSARRCTVPKPLKAIFTIAGIVLDALLLVVAVLMLLAGFWWQAALCGVGALGSLAIAAWRARARPRVVSAEAIRQWNVWDDAYADDGLSDVERQMLRYGYVDPVDVHADGARGRGEPGWPEHDFLLPPRPQHRRDNAQPKSLGGN